MPCKGEDTLICGGRSHISIFTDGTPSPAIQQDLTNPLHQTINMWDVMRKLEIWIFFRAVFTIRFLQHVMLGFGFRPMDCANFVHKHHRRYYTFLGMENERECCKSSSLLPLIFNPYLGCRVRVRNI